MSKLLDRHKNLINADLTDWESIKSKKLADKILEIIDNRFCYDEKDFFVCAGNKFRNDNEAAFMIQSRFLMGYNPLERFIQSVDEEYPNWYIDSRTEEDVLVGSKKAKYGNFFSDIVYRTIYSNIRPIFIVSQRNTDEECKIVYYSG